MAFIIKSNSRLASSANSIGNIHSFYAAPDYRVMLDFSNGIYKVDGNKKNISDVVLVSRASTATYLDVFGEQKEVGFNMPRISYLPESSESGLLIETTAENKVTGDANGSSFTVINASEDLYVSWSGAGTVTPIVSGVTLRREVISGNRTHRFYTRTSALTGTIAVTGNVSEVMVANSLYARSYLKPLQKGFSDVVRFAPLVKQVLSGGKGTILCRFILSEGTGRDNHVFHIAAVNSTALGGSVLASTTYKSAGLGEASVSVAPNDAAINTGVRQARLLGNRNKTAIMGMAFSAFGASTGIIAYGQSGFGNTASNPATPPTTLDEVYLGTAIAGILSFQQTANAVLTHCIVYDRVLTPEEANEAAFFGH